MKLQLESGKVIRDATEEDILTLVEGEEFAILLADEDTYIQCAEQTESPYEYILEYQEGSTKKHYRATDEPITLEQVLSAFVKYLNGDPTWQIDFQWEKIKV